MDTMKKGNMQDQAMGTWFVDSTGTVFLKCPLCGRVGSLRSPGDKEGHEIDSYGVVSPSLICPRKGCPFHTEIQLEDWKDEAHKPLS